MEELTSKFVGEIVMFKTPEADTSEAECSTIVEVVEIRGPVIELAFNVGKRRVYLSFLAGDLLRALGEGSGAENDASQ